MEEKFEAEDIITEDMTAEFNRLKTENEELSRRLFCAGEGMPTEMFADIEAIAAKNVTADKPFEEAAKEAYDRLCGYSEGKELTTGVRIGRGGKDADAALRRAFGLRR